MHQPILFVGGLFPPEQEDRLNRDARAPIQAAANVLQWGFVRGLDEVLGRPVQLLNSVYVGSWPRLHRRLLMPTTYFAHTTGAYDLDAGFVNLPLIKHWSRWASLRPRLVSWLQDCSHDRPIVIAYSMSWVMLRILVEVKRVSPQAATVLIVPDLPEYMNMSQKASPAYQLFKRTEIRLIKRSLHAVDQFVLLTEAMTTSLGLEPEKTIVVEGIADPPEQAPSFPVEQGERVIFYGGTLHQRYGILDLVEAFRGIPDTPWRRYKLVICGTGDAAASVRTAQRLDSRIDYRGQLPRKEVLVLQNEAHVLVNPRRNTGAYTKYSFPSKILEYLAMGRPVVAYQLDGIPAEYQEVIEFVHGDGRTGLKQVLEDICSRPADELSRIGRRNWEFVSRRKNPRIQAEKLLRSVTTP